ncbi:hypothetical protein AB0P21_36980 [Kribbella sp. NPDC056861]|uniref:hypothetical protein n=1 Tax=Kribbella sp. NPDC056861 TaxID=3154857 RepID=UPI00341B5478
MTEEVPVMTAEPLLVPVGHDAGARHAAGGGCHQIRAGLDLAELREPEYIVWLVAHGTDAQAPATRSSVLRDATELELSAADVTTITDRLIADGLLAEVFPEADAAVDFARQHQLVPLMLGLGPDPEQPALQTIGLYGRPVLQVSDAVFDVWEWAQLTPHLWFACEDAAEVARRSGVTAPQEVDPRGVLAGLLRSVHGLLCSRAAYLDRRELAG